MDGHDDLGMEELLQVRNDAPLFAAKKQAKRSDGGATVRIAGFAYEPATIETGAGETVTWTNDDPAAHTVTHESGDFASKTLARGEGFGGGSTGGARSATSARFTPA